MYSTIVMRPLQSRKKLDWATVRFPRYITLYASKLAGCANMHKYVSREELKNELIAYIKNDDTFKNEKEVIAEAYQAITEEEKVRLDAIISTTYSDTRDVQKALDSCADIIKPTESCEKVFEHVRRTLFTTHGIQGEDSIRKAVELKTNVCIETCNRFTTSVTPMLTVNGVNVFVGGKHDGLVDNQKIVEIKKRQRGFLGVPLYEKVQIHGYMFIYGVTSGTLVESYLGVERSHDIEFDPVFWNEVTANIEKFMMNVLSATD